MVKNNTWEIGSLVRSIVSKDLFKIQRVYDNESAKITMVEMVGMVGGKNCRVVCPLLFMGKYYENLGDSGKGFNALWLK